jgi:hypothetical protein
MDFALGYPAALDRRHLAKVNKQLGIQLTNWFCRVERRLHHKNRLSEVSAAVDVIPFGSSVSLELNPDCPHVRNLVITDHS